MKTKGIINRYIQEVIFGFEDSFVSTVGAITGMAVGSGSREIVILAGLVVIFVEATSMAGGSYLSDKVKHDMVIAQGGDGRDKEHSPISAGVVMGLSYLAAGIFPLLPYLLLPVAQAIIPSVVLTLVMLFSVGVGQTHFTKRTWWKSGGEMFLVGGAAIVLGFLVGRLASQVLGISI